MDDAISFMTGRELAEELSRMRRWQVTTAGELAEWTSRANMILKRLASPVVERIGLVPESVWHYLIDADIRFKDAEYRTAQERLIDELITRLSSTN